MIRPANLGPGLASKLAIHDPAKVWTCIAVAVVYPPMILMHKLGEAAPVTIIGVTASTLTVILCTMYAVGQNITNVLRSRSL